VLQALVIIAARTTRMHIGIPFSWLRASPKSAV
jgi:hypothetical protein